jgi:hypothetical protein
MLFLESHKEFKLHIWKSGKSDDLEAEQDTSGINVRSIVKEKINIYIIKEILKKKFKNGRG